MTPQFTHSNAIVKRVRARLAVHEAKVRQIAEHVDRASRHRKLHVAMVRVWPRLEKVMLALRTMCGLAMALSLVSPKSNFLRSLEERRLNKAYLQETRCGLIGLCMRKLKCFYERCTSILRLSGLF